jgi:DNA-binding transcriptional ArsR family regulator
MDHETLYTASKWQILKQLEKDARSPLELAKLCNTSIANVSQQLRLLEMAGLVTATRVSNRDKDKPRILYSLAGNLSYMISTSDSFVDKRMLQLSDYNKIIMRIWFFEQKELHYTLEKAFWKIEDRLTHLQFLAVDTRQTSPVTLYVKGERLDLKPFTITDPVGVTRQILFSTKIPHDHLHVLYEKTERKAEKTKRGGGK